MGNMHFKVIDDTNELLVRRIKLKAGQEKYIETVDECLKEAEIHHQWRPVAIYLDEQAIGFAMYGTFGPNKDSWIDRIMIDEKFQGKGLGRLAMGKLIEVVSREYGVNVVYLSIIEDNQIAYRLYESMGFEFINERDPNGELIFQYTIS